MAELILDLTQELEAEYQKKITARNVQKALEKPRELKNKLIDCLPSVFGDFCRLKATESKKTNLPKKSNSSEFDERDFFYEDEQGRSCIKAADVERLNDLEAIERHGNDPDKRFDEWDFPGTARERAFILKHDFGALIKDSLIALESGSWVYAHGSVGLGKTSLAMRVAWELLRDKPSRKATFISMNQYSLDQIKRDNAEQAAIRRGERLYEKDLNFNEFVILDDFDKVNFNNEHKTRVVLSLIESLKKGRHKVFITAQIALGYKEKKGQPRRYDAIYNKYRENWDMKPLADRLREMCLVLPEFTGQSKRRFE